MQWHLKEQDGTIAQEWSLCTTKPRDGEKTIVLVSPPFFDLKMSVDPWNEAMRQFLFWQSHRTMMIHQNHASHARRYYGEM